MAAMSDQDMAALGHTSDAHTPAAADRETDRPLGATLAGFGLVNVDVKFAPIVDPKGNRVSGKFLDPTTKQPVSQQYVNEKGKVWDILTDTHHETKEHKAFMTQSAAAARWTSPCSSRKL